MKRVLVTCGTGEIGRRIATLLATHGHEVIVTGRNPDTLTSFVSMLPIPVGCVEGHQSDTEAEPREAVSFLAALTYQYEDRKSVV